MSKANGLLAEALGVKAFPTLQVSLLLLPQPVHAFLSAVSLHNFYTWQICQVPVESDPLFTLTYCVSPLLLPAMCVYSVHV